MISGVCEAHSPAGEKFSDMDLLVYREALLSGVELCSSRSCEEGSGSSRISAGGARADDVDANDTILDLIRWVGSGL